MKETPSRILNLFFNNLFSGIFAFLRALLQPSQFLFILKSCWKGLILSDLQRIITNGTFIYEESETHFADMKKEGARKLIDRREKYLDKYLNKCLHSWTPEVYKFFGISFEDLKENYSLLASTVANQYVKGHYVPLSTFAYFEPLFFYFSAPMPISMKAKELVSYFQGEEQAINNLLLFCKEDLERFCKLQAGQEVSLPHNNINK